MLSVNKGLDPRKDGPSYMLKKAHIHTPGTGTHRWQRFCDQQASRAVDLPVVNTYAEDGDSLGWG